MSCGDCCDSGAKMCPHPLGYHSDVSAAAPADRDVLAFDEDSGMWVPTSLSELCILIDELCNVTIDSEANQDFLWYNSGTEMWENVPIGDVADTLAALIYLNDLADTNVPSPTDGQYLTWDDGTSRWVATTLSLSLNDLSDVDNADSPTACEVLKGDGSGGWEAGELPLNCLSDVVITSAATGEVLQFNGTNWVDAALDCDDIANASGVTGATVCDALDNLQGQITSNDGDIASLDSRLDALEGGGGGGGGGAVIGNLVGGYVPGTGSGTLASGTGWSVSTAGSGVYTYTITGSGSSLANLGFVVTPLGSNSTVDITFASTDTWTVTMGSGAAEEHTFVCYWE